MNEEPARTASEQVLRWIEVHIERHGLTAGDPLPAELEIAEAAGVGRSSVREAVTALRAMGLIESRRKGGMRLLRDPVLLELRHYFEDPLGPERFVEAMEFRAALEWGLASLMFARSSAATVRALRRIVETVRDERAEADIADAEIRFHTTLMIGCGNTLCSLMAHLYLPLFREDIRLTPLDRDEPTIAQWVAEHTEIMDALARRDEPAFLEALRKHTHGAMRPPRRPRRRLTHG